MQRKILLIILAILCVLLAAEVVFLGVKIYYQEFAPQVSAAVGFVCQNPVLA